MLIPASDDLALRVGLALLADPRPATATSNIAPCLPLTPTNKQ